MSPKTESSVTAPIEVFAAPSWISRMSTSASSLAASPSVSWVATRFTLSTTSPTTSVSMPAGLTSEGSSSVTAPMKPTFTPWKSCR